MQIIVRPFKDLQNLIPACIKLSIRSIYGSLSVIPLIWRPIKYRDKLLAPRDQYIMTLGKDNCNKYFH